MFLSALVLMLTSCEGTLDDIFGEWSRPTQKTPGKEEKKAATISYATTSVTKTYGDADFINELTNTGDGTVTYSSSNTDVAEIDATSGSVTIKNNGETTITATVTDSETYTYEAKTTTYILGVGTAPMDAPATGFNGAYDKTAHAITVNAPEGATIKYGTTEGTYDLDASPTYTNAGKYTVYYQVTKPAYTTFIGSADVEITKAAATITFAKASISKTYGDDDFTNELTNSGDGTVTYKSSKTAVADINKTTGEVTLKDGGDATITATVTDGENYTYATKTATYTLNVKDAYIYYDLSTGESKKKVVLAENCKVVTTTTTSWDNTKTFVVESDVTINGKVTLSGAVNLILCDGAKLTINGQIYGGAATLTIYAQSTGSKMGQMSVIKTASDASTNSGALYCSTLNIHGGKLEFVNQYQGESDCNGIRVPGHDIKIYGGDVKAQAYSAGGDGIETSSSIKVIISGGKLETIGGDDSSTYNYGGYGINGLLEAKGNAVVIATGGKGHGAGVGQNAEVSGKANVTATGGEGNSYEGGRGFGGNLTVSGNATVKATGGYSSTSNGGQGVSSNLTIKDNANVTAIGGKGYRGGPGVGNDLYYHGGKFSIECGDGTDINYAIYVTLYNEADASVSFEGNKYSTGWEQFSVDGHSSKAMNTTPRYIAVRKQ